MRIRIVRVSHCWKILGNSIVSKDDNIDLCFFSILGFESLALPYGVDHIAKVHNLRLFEPHQENFI